MDIPWVQTVHELEALREVHPIEMLGEVTYDEGDQGGGGRGQENIQTRVLTNVEEDLPDTWRQVLEDMVTWRQERGHGGILASPDARPQATGLGEGGKNLLWGV